MIREVGQVTVLLLVILLVGGVTVRDARSKEDKSQPYKTSGEYRQMLPSRSQSLEQIRQAGTKAQTLEISFPDKPVIAGVVPHDIRHAEYIAHFFEALSRNRKVETIVLIGPNHFEHGGSTILTANADWETPTGSVRANREMLGAIQAKVHVESEPDVFIGEHSISAIVPYIAAYLPNARIVPFILKYETTQDELNGLVKAIAASSDDTTVLVGPIDFSHYLSSARAEQNDRWTAQRLTAFDDKAFLTLGPNFNDYVDSPASIAAVLFYAKLHGATAVEILENTNSGKLSGMLGDPTTSYFEVAIL